jgi:hypothetical protein
MYYVRKKEGLEEELSSRQSEKAEYASRIDAFAQKEFGIADFTEISKNGLNLRDGQRYGVLCRQVATARIEEVAYLAASRYLNLAPVNFTLTGDVFNSRNIDKVHLVKLRLITGHSENGKPIVCVRTLAKPSDVEGLILNKILLGKVALPEYHFSLRQKTFSACLPPTRDVGNLLFSLYLKAAKNPPSFVFVTDGARSVKKETCASNLETARPPAFWYYPLYLANFVLGNLVLYETYENKRGGVPKIREDFRAAMDRVKDAVGIYPLVVQIPPLDETMLSINEALYGGGWLDKIVIPENFSGDTVSLFELAAKQAIAIRKNGSS